MKIYSNNNNINNYSSIVFRINDDSIIMQLIDPVVVVVWRGYRLYVRMCDMFSSDDDELLCRRDTDNIIS